jgi:phosphatidylglycerol:prolipoprotein diacylglycerol transferase
MVIIGLDPVIVRWGPFTLTWHGLFLVAGVALGCWIFLRRARAEGLPRDPLVELLIWAVLGGFIGARLIRVFLYDWPIYATQPLRILAPSEGGMAWQGAVIGGTMAAAGVAYWRKLPFWRVVDASVFAELAALIVIRLGCIIAGDLCGVATGGEWGLVYTHSGASVPPYLRGVPTFPAPFLMQAADAALLGLLLALGLRPRPPGTLFLVYLVAYSAGRFLISFWQVERSLLLGLHPTQVLAVAIGLSAATALAAHRRRVPAGAGPGGAAGR